MAKNWYPVINTETCTQCGKCVAFCKHGVYGKASPKKPEVVCTDGCVDHCHGCGGLCPTGSITYFGDDTGWTPPNMNASDCACGERDDSIMKTMYIYEPAMCCDTGICGVGVDPELIRVSAVLNALKKNGVVIKRYNLSNYPQEFVKNADINKLLNDEGVDILPATVVDGEIVKTKAYPTNGEIVMWLNISPDYLVEKPANGGGCRCSSSDGKCC